MKRSLISTAQGPAQMETHKAGMPSASFELACYRSHLQNQEERMDTEAQSLLGGKTRESLLAHILLSQRLPGGAGGP